MFSCMVETWLVFKSFGSQILLLPHYFLHFREMGFRPMENFHQVPQRLRLLWLRTCWPLPGPWRCSSCTWFFCCQTNCSPSVVQTLRYSILLISNTIEQSIQCYVKTAYLLSREHLLSLSRIVVRSYDGAMKFQPTVHCKYIFTVLKCLPISTVISLYGLHLIAAPSTVE